MVLGEQFIQDVCRIMATAVQPLFSAHATQVRECRSGQECLRWHCDQASGGAFEPVSSTMALLSDSDALEKATLAPHLSGALLHDDPLVMFEDAKASMFGRLILNLVDATMSSAVWHLWQYPGRFAALVDEPTAGPVLEDMRACKEAWKDVEEKTGQFWAKWKNAQFLMMAFVSRFSPWPKPHHGNGRKLFQMLCHQLSQAQSGRRLSRMVSDLCATLKPYILGGLRSLPWIGNGKHFCDQAWRQIRFASIQST